MSLGIEIDDVTAVLLAGEWTEIKPGTFDLDAYEFMDGERIVHGGGNSGVCATGFVFTTPDGLRITGPLTSILAVRQGRTRGR